jgi:hypothetical protein
VGATFSLGVNWPVKHYLGELQKISQEVVGFGEKTKSGMKW